jgi:hypothetical protein
MARLISQTCAGVQWATRARSRSSRTVRQKKSVGFENPTYRLKI